MTFLEPTPANTWPAEIDQAVAAKLNQTLGREPTSLEVDKEWKEVRMKQPKAVKAYLAALVAVGKQHGFSLCYDEERGSLFVETRENSDSGLNDKILSEAKFEGS